MNKHYLIAQKLYSKLKDEEHEKKVKKRLERLYKVTGALS